MASETVRSVLNHLWNALEPLEQPCALIGGLALAVWSHPRATRDIDLLVGLDRRAIDQVINLLAAAECRTKKSPPLTLVGDHSFLQLLFTPPGEFYDVQFDLLLAESPYQQEALSRSVERTVEGIDRPLWVLNCDDLILFKLLAGRLIDRADAVALLHENHESLDLDRLAKWVGELGLSADFRSVWCEALPDRVCPIEG